MEQGNIGRPAAKIQVELSEEQRSEVDELAKQDDVIGEKAKLLLLLASGEYTKSELATMTKKERQQILNFMSRFNKHGVQAVRRKYIFTKEPVRHAKITKEGLSDLLGVAQKSPRESGLEFDNWTLLRLAGYIKDKYDVQLTRERIRQILQKNNIQHFTNRQIPSAKRRSS